MPSPYNPKEVIFAPTAQCNLACAHCRVDRTKGLGGTKLTAGKAITFLRDCAAQGIERVGFSGGEPFLEPDFLYSVCAEAVDLDLYFDRLMTNGDWYQDEERLRLALERLYDSGFDGTIGLSLDRWHGQDPLRTALFIGAVIEAAGRADALEIDCALDPDGSYPVDLFSAVAERLTLLRCGFEDVKLILEDGIPAAIEDITYRTNADKGMDDGSGLRITVTGIPLSRGADDPAAWKAEAWFKDDWCAGPGNVLYVHADGSVAACCGFANERPELGLGTVEDPVENLIEKGMSHPFPRLCYQTGLSAYRESLEAQGIRFPGKTDDMCFFCDWLCSQGKTPQRN